MKDLPIWFKALIALWVLLLVWWVFSGVLLFLNPSDEVIWRSDAGKLQPIDARGQELKLTITFDGDMLVEPKETE